MTERYYQPNFHESDSIGNQLASQNGEFAAWVDHLEEKYALLAAERSILRPHIEILINPPFLANYTGEDERAYKRHYEILDQIERVDRQIDHAQSGIILHYTDSVDLSAYSQYISKPGQLGYKFNLPPALPMSLDPRDNSPLLGSLPFVKFELNDLAPLSALEPRITLHGRIDFPIERIISVASFDSWEGRGHRGEGGKGHSSDEANPLAGTSKGHITSMALNLDIPLVDTDVSDTCLEVVQDAAGEYWGVSYGDGSHRLAAAKLLGHSMFPISWLSIPANNDMAKIPYSVKEYFV